MIAYFDTSAVIPLMVEEPTSRRCERVWNESTRIVSVRLVYVEARAALAQAARMGRISNRQLPGAVAELEAVVREVDHVEITDALVRRAGDLAEQQALRGYDAIHLAAALSIADDDVVLVTGDAQLAEAATSLGLAVAATG